MELLKENIGENPHDFSLVKALRYDTKSPVH